MTAYVQYIQYAPEIGRVCNPLTYFTWLVTPRLKITTATALLLLHRSPLSSSGLPFGLLLVSSEVSQSWLLPWKWEYLGHHFSWETGIKSAVITLVCTKSSDCWSSTAPLWLNRYTDPSEHPTANDTSNTTEEKYSLKSCSKMYYFQYPNIHIHM